MTHSCSSLPSRKDRSPRSACSRTSAWFIGRLLVLFWRRLQLEPEEPARREGEQVRQLADPREAAAAVELHRVAALVLGQVQLDGLRRARDVVDAEDHV